MRSWSVLVVLAIAGVACSVPQATEPSDAAMMDASGADASAVVDAGIPDAATVDASTPDASTPDAGLATDAGSGAPDASTSFVPKTVFGGDRPVTLHVPAGYLNEQPIPLIILLHGYNATGASEASYLGMLNISNEQTTLLAAPDGTPDSAGKRFWNATDSCCNFDNMNVDDVSYIAGLVTEISASYNVDPKRVYLVGHSNGGFMSYRMACEHPEMFAAIASLAGATWYDTTKCQPSQPVSILEVHGTADTIVLYGGLAGPNPNGIGHFPGAVADMNDWRTYNGCSSTLVRQSAQLDLESSLTGQETVIDEVGGCPSGIDLQLWSIMGGGHLPKLTTEFHTDVWNWLMAHPKP